VNHSFRLQPKEIIHSGTPQKQSDDRKQSASDLQACLANWLDSDQFRSVDKQLREELSRDDTIQVLIRAQDHRLCRLPWHLWDFIERYPKAEVVFSTSSYRRVHKPYSALPKGKVRILAILGSSNGIDVDVDRAVLNGLPDADVTFLVEPERQDLNDHLWKQPWDILFFAGHSETAGNQGRIYINSHDSLVLAELEQGLSHAVAQGLQLAIFNSCDGLGLAYDLEYLHIPQIIVMREPVPDRVAQAFLKFFLEAFPRTHVFHLAVRQARERLKEIEIEKDQEYSCASWLPVVFQNPGEVVPTWSELCGQNNAESLHHSILRDSKSTSVATDRDRFASRNSRAEKSVSLFSPCISTPSAAKTLLSTTESKSTSILSSENHLSHVNQTIRPDSRNYGQTSSIKLFSSPEVGEVDQPINGADGHRGRVKYRSTFWSARFYHPDCNVSVSRGELVDVVGMQGIVLLIVPQGYTPSHCPQPGDSRHNHQSILSTLARRLGSAFRQQ
jgi:hypothetical protein